jgi:hypothetical protein
MFKYVWMNLTTDENPNSKCFINIEHKDLAKYLIEIHGIVMATYTLIRVSRYGIEPVASTVIYYIISSTDITDMFKMIDMPKYVDNKSLIFGTLLLLYY